MHYLGKTNEGIKELFGVLRYRMKNDYWEIELIRVAEAHRQKGIGTELIGELKKRANGIPIIVYTDSDIKKEVFGKFLVANGFQRHEMNNTSQTKGGNVYWELK